MLGILFFKCSLPQWCMWNQISISSRFLTGTELNCHRTELSLINKIFGKNYCLWIHWECKRVGLYCCTIQYGDQITALVTDVRKILQSECLTMVSAYSQVRRAIRQTLAVNWPWVSHGLSDKRVFGRPTEHGRSLSDVTMTLVTILEHFIFINPLGLTWKRIPCKIHCRIIVPYWY